MIASKMAMNSEQCSFNGSLLWEPRHAILSRQHQKLDHPASHTTSHICFMAPTTINCMVC